MVINHNFKIDIDNNVPQSLSVRTHIGDHNSHELNIELYHHNKKIEIKNTAEVTIYCVRSDGTKLYTSCSIDSNTIKHTLTTGNANTSGELDVSGILECELLVVDSGKSITTPKFRIVVDNVIRDESAICTDNNFSALTSALSQVQSVATGLPTKEDKVNKATTIETDSYNNTKYPSVKATKDYVDNQINSAVSALNNSKVDKVDGKGLSTCDYTAEHKAKVEAIPANPKYTDTVYDDTELSGRVETIESAAVAVGERIDGIESNITDITNSLDDKQDTLTAGDNITIVNNVISASGGGGTTYTAGDGIDITDNTISIDEDYLVDNNVVDYTGSTHLNEIVLFNNRYGTIKSSGKKLTDLQDKLIAGDNITINGNTISASGGSAKPYQYTEYATITTTEEVVSISLLNVENAMTINNFRLKIYIPKVSAVKSMSINITTDSATAMCTLPSSFQNASASRYCISDSYISNGYSNTQMYGNSTNTTALTGFLSYYENNQINNSIKNITLLNGGNTPLPIGTKITLYLGA